MSSAEIVIAGAGIIGLSLALEFRQKGLRTVVLAPDLPGYASIAAAGMLAAHDPANPPELQPLAELSLSLYPRFLDRIQSLTGIVIPFETRFVLEADSTGEPGNQILPALATDQRFTLRPEKSIDPRKLLPALRKAVLAAGADLKPAHVLSAETERSGSVRVETTAGCLSAETYIDCTGAWTHSSYIHVAKGQMLRIQLPPATLQSGAQGNLVLRTPGIYIVPRLDGTALIGATVEDAGFSTHTTADGLQGLRNKAANLLPALAEAPEIESWAGLRPRTADSLPILGRLAPHHYIATGHFRNGVLLAPATARLMSQMILGSTPDLDLTRFDPQRFAPASLALPSR